MMHDEAALAPGDPAATWSPAERQWEIVRYCETFLDRHGDSPLGVGWPNIPDAWRRHQVMLDVIRPGTPRPVRLLDFGCGASHLYEHLRRTGREDVEYQGLDLSTRFLELSRAKYPAVPYHQLDILAPGARLPDYDYAVINGVFTSKCSMTFDESFDLFQRIVTRLFESATAGVAVNAMSKHVDWERDDLFHLPLDRLADFLTRRLTRNYVIRNDYGLYEFTTYIYR